MRVFPRWRDEGTFSAGFPSSLLPCILGRRTLALSSSLCCPPLGASPSAKVSFVQVFTVSPLWFLSRGLEVACPRFRHQKRNI